MTLKLDPLSPAGLACKVPTNDAVDEVATAAGEHESNTINVSCDIKLLPVRPSKTHVRPLMQVLSWPNPAGPITERAPTSTMKYSAVGH